MEQSFHQGPAAGADSRIVHCRVMMTMMMTMMMMLTTMMMMTRTMALRS